MSKTNILPAAIFVAALPVHATAQSYPPIPSPAVPVYVPPAAPAPPGPPIVRRGVPANDPATWFRFKDYPKGAKKRGEQGRVDVALSVGKNGKPTACTIRRSSGSPELDAVTCASVMKRARFVPQLGASGKPEPFTWPVVTRWRLFED